MQREFAVIIDGAAAEALADALLAAGALAVTLEDADADGADEAPLYGEPGHEPARAAWNSNRLIFMAPSDATGTAMLATAAATLGCTAPAIVATRDVGDIDWVRRTQAQFAPTRISARLWIVPTWHEPTDPAAINIRLDPGAAFGTGTHPTTQLCLRWLDHNLERVTQRDLLDYGCGSGILAIAAAKLGARACGTDIDPLALDTARANAQANGVAVSFDAPESLGSARYDVVLANILSNPLKLLAPALIARLNDRGVLVLSGILERQAQEIIDCYRQAGATLSVWGSAEGWCCLAGVAT
jgi:ribosomal protein L11 methyltransferase